MTTVIIDKVDKKVYSDTRASWERVESKWLGLRKKRTLHYEDNYHKVWRCRNTLFACAGGVNEIEGFIHKFGRGQLCKLKGSKIYAIDINNGSLSEYGTGGSFESNRYVVLGSGCHTAWARLYAGFTPVEAIKPAHLEDPYTSNKVRVVSYLDDLQ
jgi:hypothetical protein